MRRSVERVANVAGPLAMIAAGAHLGLATQALGEPAPTLGLRLAHVYTWQRAAAAFQDQFAQALMTDTPAPRGGAVLPALDSALMRE